MGVDGALSMSNDPIDLGKERDRRRKGRDSANGGNGRLTDLEIRLARVEERVDAIKENMATKADLAKMETSIVRLLLGILAAAAISVVVALVRTFTA